MLVFVSLAAAVVVGIPFGVGLPERPALRSRFCRSSA